jgi:hypothetical protein
LRRLESDEFGAYYSSVRIARLERGGDKAII